MKYFLVFIPNLKQLCSQAYQIQDVKSLSHFSVNLEQKQCPATTSAWIIRFLELKFGIAPYYFIYGDRYNFSYSIELLSAPNAFYVKKKASSLLL